MHRFKTFIIFLLLVSIWSIFFTTIKFFLWSDLANSIKPDLETISGYLSFGGVFAYLIGGSVAYSFLKKYLLFGISILALLIIIIGYYFGIDSNFFLGFIVTFIGFYYGLWSVLKNILIAIEIDKTKLPDTVVTAFAGIIFVVFIILGTILGNLVFETFGKGGIIIIFGLLILSSIVSLFLDYDKVSLKSLFLNGARSYYYDKKRKFSVSMKSYFPEMKFIIKKYGAIMLVSSMFWAISTIISLQVIQISVENFGKTNSEASILMLYSAIGVIIGNVISIKMEKKRWKYFKLFSIIFAEFVFFIPLIGKTYFIISIMALIIGILFGIASNLIDAFFFRKIGEENKKEYGSSTYGLILSIVIFVMMFFSSFVVKYFSFDKLMYLLGIIIFICSLFNFEKQATSKIYNKLIKKISIFKKYLTNN